MAAASISAQRGRDFLIKIGDGASPPTYTTLGGLQSNDYSAALNPVDITNKGSNGWRELMPNGGVQQVTITGTGEFDANSAQFKIVKNAFFNRVLIQAEIIDQVGDRVYGYWAVASLKESGTYNGAQMYDITLESSGPIAGYIV